MAKEKQEEGMGEMEQGGEETTTTTSKTSGYRYWVRGTMQGAAPEPVPHKLTAEELAGNGKPACLGSTWNQAGTWEEKVLSSWAWNRVKELLPTVEPVEFEGGTARVVEVTTCSGDASLITVRQKKKVGYTLEIEMKYSANVKQGEEKKDFEGKMKVPEACYGELDDLELDVIVSASDIKDSVQRKRVKQTLMDMFLPKIRRKLEDFEAELKER